MATLDATASDVPARPTRIPETAPPPIPDVDSMKPDQSSLQLSQHRTRLSTHRTGLSEHRTQLSEHRTDLSTHRTALSEHRTSLSTNRTEMSARRTGMSFQRTRMSADRTLMSVIRTSLSLIGFGFTIAQFFQKLHQAEILVSSTAPKNFGIALVLLGVGMLAVGIGYHVSFMLGLRRTRTALKGSGLIHAESHFPSSLTLVVALLLLLIGLFAIASLVFGSGPFG